LKRKEKNMDSPIIMTEETLSPEEAAAAHKQREQFDRNSEWLQGHIPEIYGKYRGKCICIAGQEVFVSDSVEDAVASATAAHPEDQGWFTRYIPKEKVARIYAI
jgi:hypothetical protein